MVRILDGKCLAEKIKIELLAENSKLKEKNIFPGLAVILVGEDPASKVYVGSKEKACQELGIYSEVYRLDSGIGHEDILSLIKKLNNDPKIHGILVQLPMPKHLGEDEIIAAIDPGKDVDCFCQENVGKIVTGNYGFLPCTPSGILELIKRNDIVIEGKECVVVGRSNIVGKPVALMLLNEGGTVTICHSKTRDLKTETLRADILVAAAGRAGLITADMVKPGATVIDVGINRMSSGKLVGDVDFEKVKEIAGAITPVPGGVGPMTIAMLMKNTIEAAKKLAE